MRVLLLLIWGLGLAVPLALAQSSSQDEYAVPVDSTNYAEEWQNYQPEKGAKAQTGRVTYSGLKMVSAPEEFEKNTTPEELAKFVAFIEEVLNRESAGFEQGGEIIFHVKLRKEKKPLFKMSHRGELTQAYMQGAYEVLATAIDYKMKQGPVVLQVRYIVKSA